MNAIYKFVDKIALLFSKIGALLSIVIMCLMTLHIMYEIILRSVFQSSTYILDEMVGYGIAAMTFLSLGYAFRHNSLIRVNILLSVVKNEVSKKLIELFCLIVAISSSSLVLYYFSLSVAKYYARGSKSNSIAEVPLWIPEIFVCIGLGIFILELLRRVLGVLLSQEESIILHSEGGE